MSVTDEPAATPPYYRRLPTDPTDAQGYEYFQPSESTVSVWSTQIQHGGPPSALLVRALERCTGDASGKQFSRVTIDILGAVSLGVNRVCATMIRPGRQIAQVQAELETQGSDATFRVAARATAWLLMTSDTAAIVEDVAPPLRPGPDDVATEVGISSQVGEGVSWGDTGFVGTVRFGQLPTGIGATAATWLQPTVDLVAGERASPLQRFFTVVDVANGLGTTLQPDEWSWMNTDTTVHLVRPPRGDWFGIDSRMAVGPTGVGATFSELFDDQGCVGRGAQTTLLSRQQHG
ncbi:thioesterase family protein [Williamsia sterculiae]|uniref:Thioesterase-like superfamily protein n=1 Tax=Williamsia sterculiae TaxID=1344003 RepID=A0A1N7EMC0_9NOCA|nr:thioesterase family protein [Williamsia sterculiae]SIR89220.1 Thioesterase-like superfamily protein [Williamsia sterculiae]